MERYCSSRRLKLEPLQSSQRPDDRESNPQKIHCIRVKDDTTDEEHEELWVVANGRIEKFPTHGGPSEKINNLFKLKCDLTTGEEEKDFKVWEVTALTQAEKSLDIVLVCKIETSGSGSSSHSDSHFERKWLVEVSAEGGIKDIVATGCYGDVCAHHDEIFGITEPRHNNESETPKIISHTKSKTGEWKQKHIKTLEFYMGGILTTTDYFYTVQQGGEEPYILELHRDSTSPPNPTPCTQFRSPYLCVSDTNGAVLVADRHNDRFQVLSKDGSWTELKFHSNILKPRDATMDSNGDLYIIWRDWKDQTEERTWSVYKVI